MLQRDNVSVEAGATDGASLGVTKSGGASVALNNVSGMSWCSVETGSGTGGASGIILNVTALEQRLLELAPRAVAS